MSLIAIVHIAHDDLALAPTIRACPDTAIRVMSQSVTDPKTGLFFFYVENGGAAVESAFDRDHTVVEWTQVSDAESGAVYRLQHPPETKLLSPKTVELGGLMLEAASDATGWTVRLQFPDRESLSRLWGYCDDEDISFDLRRLFRDQTWDGSDLRTLTDAQFEALTTAHEEGYFEEPREISLEELADMLDISPTAVGGRIRRGMAALIEATLADE
jgi:predicted DNA binding protein